MPPTTHTGRAIRTILAIPPERPRMVRAAHPTWTAHGQMAEPDAPNRPLTALLVASIAPYAARDCAVLTSPRSM